jgi:hypothetical protein
LDKEVNNTLDMTLDQVKFEKDETKQRDGRIEQQVEEVFKTIVDSMQERIYPHRVKLRKQHK